MDWLKLYTSLPDDEKLIAAGAEDGWHLHLALYVCGLCYCAKNETDGRIPKAQMPRLSTVPDAPELAGDLVGAGLWHDKGSHYVVHGYTERQRTKAQLDRVREVRAEAGRKGGQASKKASNPASNEATNEPSGEPSNLLSNQPSTSSLVSSSLSTSETGNGPVAPARTHAHEPQGDVKLQARLAEVRSILNEIAGEREPLTALNDVQLLRAIESCPGVDPIEAAKAAVARGRQNLPRPDAFLRELRALRTALERTREQHKPDAAVIHKLATTCRDCGRELKAASDRASGTCQACDEKRLEGAA